MSASRTPAQILRDARQKDSRTKRARVLSVVDQLVADEEPVTFIACASPAPRGEARGQAKAPAGWKAEQEILREENRRMRAEVDRLEAAVRRSLGQRLDQLGAADLGARVDELTADKEKLQESLDQALARIEELTGKLAEAQDDLASARTSLRRMIRARTATQRADPSRNP